MKKPLLLVLLFGMPVPAWAHDHQWFYDQSVWQADLDRGRELVQLMDCESALLASARQQFNQYDQQALAVHRYVHFPAPARPATIPPRPVP